MNCHTSETYSRVLAIIAYSNRLLLFDSLDDEKLEIDFGIDQVKVSQSLSMVISFLIIFFYSLSFH